MGTPRTENIQGRQQGEGGRSPDQKNLETSVIIEVYKISKLPEDRIENRKTSSIKEHQVDGAAGGRGLGWLHNKRILHGELKTNNVFVFTGTHEPVIKIGALGSLLRLDAFGVYSRGYYPAVHHLLHIRSP